jgi:alanyl-tRNA synthetase
LLGDHVEQQGSKVEPTALRFDFNHPNSLTREQITAIEKWVGDAIAAKHPVDIRVMPIAEAKSMGAKAQFGEKYGDAVRVVTMGTGEVSREFCGGCHVTNTGDIGAFRIISEGASSAGIRRIVAVAGEEAAKLAAEEARVAKDCGSHVGLPAPSADDARQVDELARSFKAQLAEVPGRVAQLAREVEDLARKLAAPSPSFSGSLLQRIDQLQNEQKRLRKLDEAKQAQAAAGAADEALAKLVDVVGVPLVAAVIPGLDGKALRTLLDTLRAKRPSLCVVLGSVADGKVGLVAGVSPDLVKRGVSAGALIGKLAPLVGGRGGGKPDLAQAGGTDGAKLPEAIAAVQTLVKEALGGAGASGANG